MWLDIYLPDAVSKPINHLLSPMMWFHGLFYDYLVSRLEQCHRPLPLYQQLSSAYVDLVSSGLVNTKETPLHV